ncbi:MAG TPA: ATP-binding protein, partial [Thermoanaerobaculia bacterium]|nr:ATP-binding protein [Thermoanaerobaculia bacterium]
SRRGGAAAGERLAEALRGMPGVAAARLLDAAGRELAVAGELPGAVDPLAPFGEDAAGALAAAGIDGVAVGPGAELPGAVAALVPVRLGRDPAEARYLRLDLAAALLGAQQRALTALSLLVLGVGLAVGTVMLLFLRRLLRPYDRMVARARELAGRQGGGGADDGDDIELLVRTFERGMAALARGSAETVRGSGEAAHEGGGPGRGGEPPRERAVESSPEDGADADIAALERTLAGSVESGLLLLDAEGRVLALNPVGAELLGVPSPAAGEPLAGALADAPELAAVLDEAVRGRHRVQRREVTLARPGSAAAPGRAVPLGLTVHPLRRAAEQGGAPAGGPPVRGFLVLFADLTEARRQAEEERLADSLARLGELAAGVAHEMRNGLATLRGYLRLAERSPGEAAELVAEMHHEADHLQRVVEDFLAFARPGSVRLEEVPLGPLVARAAADPSLGGAAVRVEDAGLGGLRVLGDAQLLERAVRNLVHNAVQAQAQSPAEAQGEPAPAEPVVLRLRRDAAEALEIRVEDRGPGVTPELRERLFRPFATGRADGVGLGLALTQRIVALHGAAVRLDDRPGGGTVAVIRVPGDRIVTEGNTTDLSAAPPGTSPFLP